MPYSWNEQELLTFYKRHIEEQLLPFWHKALDVENGGVFICFSNDGTRLISSDKYVWSQGRFIWLWSRLAALCEKGILTGNAENYLAQATKTVKFLQQNAILDNGRCAYLVASTGGKKESVAGEGHDISIFVDGFVLLGLSEYIRVTRDTGITELALKLFDSVRARLEQGNFRTEPYPIPAGFEAHSVPMILLLASQELADSLQQMGHERGAEIRSISSGYMSHIMNRFRGTDSIIAEMITDDPALLDTVLCRHALPGHGMESMWFVMREAWKAGRNDLLRNAVQSVKKMFELGWDDQYGGLFRYVDRDGGKPGGRLIGDRYEQLILDTWDTKLWWPHSEALYCTLLAYRLSGDKEMLALYERIHDYTFRTFPNPDRRVGEWIQIRDRLGRPLDKVVALPVKDPFHIMRDFLLVIELLNEPSDHPIAVNME